MSQITFRIPGVEAPATELSVSAGGSQPARTYILSGGRGEGGMSDYTVNADAVLEVELESGLRFWTGAERFRDDVLRKGMVRGEMTDVVVVPTALPNGEDSRGIVGALILKTLKFFHIDVAGFVAEKLCSKWEDRCLGVDKELGPGLYAVEKSN